MAEPAEPQERLNRIVREIAQNVVAEVCSLYVLRSDSMLELYATEGLNPTAVHQAQLRLGEGLVGTIAASARPLNLSDAQKHPAFAYLPETGEEIYHSFLGVPVLRAGRTLGVLVVQNRTQRHYREDELEVLETVAMVVAEMIPKCAPHAKWIDVFCEQGAFDRDQAHTVLTAGIAHGLIPRVHGNQLRQGPGVQLAVELGAASVDHVTHVNAADIDALAQSDTVATLLPGADFCTRSSYPDARALLDAGVTVALGADCNPGTSYTTSLPFCIAIAVRDMHMTPDEAVWAATAGGARALQRTDVGALTPGARADALALDAPSHLHLAYRPGVPLISRVWREGTLAYSN